MNVTQANVLAVKMVGGFASGAVQSGDLKGGLAGAFSAGMFHGIGQAFDPGFAKTLAHGVGGGIMAELQGGKFGHGFISAGVTEALSPVLLTGDQSVFEQIAAASVIGGTASALSGGKFANGAVTAAFQMVFNHSADEIFGGRALERFRSMVSPVSGVGETQYGDVTQLAEIAGALEKLASEQGDSLMTSDGLAAERQMFLRVLLGYADRFTFAFYFHEATEARLLRPYRHLTGKAYTDQQEIAHKEALRSVGATEYDLYHPSVVRSLPQHFNSSWDHVRNTWDDSLPGD